MSIAQLKDATHVLTTTIQSTLSEPTTSLASRANIKWSKLLINGVPTGVDKETLAHSSAECQRALALDNPSYRHLTIIQLPSWVRPPFSYTPSSYSSLVVAFEDPDRSIASSIITTKWLYLFGAQATPSRDGNKSHASGKKASQVKGPAGPRLHLWVWLPLPLIMPLPHPHPANSPLPHKALASESMPKGDRPAVCCLSSARSPRSSSPNRVISCS